MSAIHTLKSVFNGGELSPMLDARVDSDKYAAGCKELTNFIPTVYGGIKKRPGTEFVGMTKTTGVTRLYSFKRSTDTNYMLEFGDKSLCFWKGGALPKRVVTPGEEFPFWLGTSTSVLWSKRGFTSGQFVKHQGADYVCKLTHADTVANTDPGTGSAWTTYWNRLTTTTGWVSGVSYALHSVVNVSGSNYICIQAHFSGSINQPISGTYKPYWEYLNSPYTFTWGLGQSYSKGDSVLAYGSSFSLYCICLEDHIATADDKPREGQDWSVYWKPVKEYEVGTIVRQGGFFYQCNTLHYPSKTFMQDIANWQAVPETEGPGVLRYEVQTPYLESEIFDLQFTQLNDVMFIAHPNHPPKRLSFFGEYRWVLEDVPFHYAPALDVNEDLTCVQVQMDGIPPFMPAWTVSTAYKEGDRITGPTTTAAVTRFFECKADHTSGTATTAATTPGGSGTTWEASWMEIFPGSYKVGDRVTAVDIGTVANKYNGEVFTCHTAYHPGSTIKDEPGFGASWELYWNFGTGYEKVATWVRNKAYPQGAKVRIGKTIYECIRTHISAEPGIMTGGGGRFGMKIVYGNKPGVSRVWTRAWRISSADTDLSGVNLAMYATDSIFTPQDVGTVWTLELGTSGVVEYIAIPDNALETSTSENNPLFIQGGFTLTTVWDTNDAMEGTITLEESLNGVTWNLVRQFTQTNVKEGNIIYNGEAPAVGAWYRITAFAEKASTKPKRVKLEAHSSVYKLPFKITACDGPSKVRGHFIMPGNQLPPVIVIGVTTSVFRKPAFSQTNGFPRTVAFHDSRLWWGGTRTHPTRIWGSQTEDYYIYLGGELATDALDLTLATVEANAIQWMTGFNRSLVVGTSGDEWTVDSGDTDGALTPANIRARRRTRYGSNRLPPQLTGDALLWIRRGGGRLHEFAYVYERDSFSAPDLTLLAEHLLHLGEVTQTAFVSCPDPVLWIVNGDYLLGLSYNREHGVTAWHKHRMRNASFLSVASMYGADGVDEVWFTVKRGTVYTIERFHPATLAQYHGGREDPDFDSTDACFVDGAKTVNGNWADTEGVTHFSGFEHLAGMNPSGGYLEGYLDGESKAGAEFFQMEPGATMVTVQGQHQKLTLGYSFVEAQMRSMNLEVLLENASSQGRNWRLIGAVPHLWRTRDFSLISGPSPERKIELPVETTDSLQELHFSGSFEKQLDWGVKSHNAYPCNLLGAVLKFEVTGG